jgi:maltose alpha-D-glucosyltransferase/alpha-amylase
MYSTYAADPRARINLGIRRRLAPLMDNDMDRIKLMNSLLLSMRGSPIVYYGDEIGMGDNVFIGDRNGVRTPMQWSPDRNAGFSRADPQRLYLPPIMDAIYGYEAVNVEAQLRDPSSLLHWMRRMLAVRSTSRAFGRGELVFLKPGNRKVLAYLRSFRNEAGEDELILCVANLSRSAQPVELDLSAFRGRVPVELMGRTAFPPVGELPYLLTLAAHGFYWFRLADDVPQPSWHQPLMPAEERPVLVLFDGWNSFFRDQVVPWRIGIAVKTRTQLETDTLPRHIEQQRWYAAKGIAVQRARLVDHVVWEERGDRLPAIGGFGRAQGWLLPLLELDGPGEAATYFAPLAIAWEEPAGEGDDERYRSLLPYAVARIRQQAAVGVMSDAFADERFCRELVAAMGEERELKTAHGTLRCLGTRRYADVGGSGLAGVPMARPQAQSSNTIVTFGERAFLKGYRRLRSGVNPEFEVGRFLTDVAHFVHCVPVAGVVEYRGDDGGVMTLALLQAYVAHQGDGWAYTLAYLQRALEAHRTRGDGGPDVHAAYCELVETLGQRTGELHRAFTTPTPDPAFRPEPLTAQDVAAWREKVAGEARGTLSLLQQVLPRLQGHGLADAQAVLAGQRDLLEQVGRVEMPPRGGLKTRIHGDFHLAQVLLVRNDFVIIDFEGEPGRSFEERRARQSPLRDVAGMLRSFSYARAAGLRGLASSPDELALLARFAAEWEAAARAAFLRGYARAVQGSTLYESFESQRALLDLFELEKALYELRYELDHRPDWVDIPLSGILGLLPR